MLEGLFYLRSEYRLMRKGSTLTGKRRDNFGRSFPSFSKHLFLRIVSGSQVKGEKNGRENQFQT
jgi:hypothetical protein